ncbi:probable inactive serine protease 58 [Talpa occidentalis]|uniref:probable inactive serine protease 58 n=1 Tax=Talpa occidentalis TaxID=50954 RepID=UPI00188E23EE|nr:probable inactive serine protease 58 [Talpa occidentalis]
MKYILSILLMVTGVISFDIEDTESLDHLLLLHLHSSYQSCVGTPIAPQWVITSAHCFLPDLQIIFHGGSPNIQDAIGEIIPYEKIIIHPNFTATSPKNDLMLIKLSVPFTFFFKRVFQWPSLMTKEAKDCIVYTWLSNREFGNTDGNLQSVKIKLNHNLNCKKVLHEKSLEDMFCIGYLLGNKEECQVITAAPAICGNELQGILSWESGCILKGYIVLFTDLHSYVPWIENIISTK